MCGLVGVAGDIGIQERKAFRNLLILDQFRGRHSTGIAVIDHDVKNNTVNHDIFKAVGAPENLFNKYDKDFKDGVFDFDCVALIGHNRHATQGEVNEEGAHPFEFKDVIGCHNGTVHQYSLSDFYGYKDFQIDSQIIFSELNENKNIANVWSKADGAMALVWWDYSDMKLKMIRNKERPLHYVFSEDNKTVFWASEVWMLTVALNQNGIKFDKAKIESVPVNKLHSFEVLNGYLTTPKAHYVHYKNITLEVGEELPERKKLAVNTGWTYPDYSNGGNWGGASQGAVKRSNTNGDAIYLMFLETHDLGDNKKKLIFEALDTHPSYPGKKLFIVVRLEWPYSHTTWATRGIDVEKDYAFIYPRGLNLISVDQTKNEVWLEAYPIQMHKSHLITNLDEYRKAKNPAQDENECILCFLSHKTEDMIHVGDECYICDACDTNWNQLLGNNNRDDKVVKCKSCDTKHIKASLIPFDGFDYCESCVDAVKASNLETHRSVNNG